MATFDGSVPKDTVQQNDDDPETTELYFDSKNCNGQTAKSTPMSTESQPKMFEFTLNDGNPEFLKYRDAVLARAEALKNIHVGIPHSEAIRLAQNEIHELTSNPGRLPDECLVQRLGEQQVVMMKMLDRLESMELGFNPKDQGAAETSGGAVNLPRSSTGGRTMYGVPTAVDHQACSTEIRHFGQGTGQLPITNLGMQSARTESKQSTPLNKSKYYNGPLVFAEETNNAHRKPMTIEKFSGSDDQSWESFLNQFMVVVTYNGWTEKESCYQLQGYMTGKAKEFIFENPEIMVHTDFVTLIDKMSERFGSSDNFVQDHKALMNRKKMRGENFRAYGQDILQLAGRLYRNDNETMRREAQQAFLRGLPDNFRMTAAVVNATSPNDLIKACQHMAAAIDMNESDVGQSKGKIYAVNNDSQQSNNRPIRRFRGPFVCYRCDKSGHIAADCPDGKFCYRCRSKEHITWDCPKNKQDSNRNSGNEREHQ